ncbi:hypothetical protein KIN20_032530 [Parelaphostrongylus tenuis]|uniref:Uncharacterized protein n=1 Tax=Parelaphostrongylus tenuis TaxID=148309 RepID=A0AAD5WI36_PARTN|nr:hypothetical protein KIN20_032530 [Parelaphostrongylus tenuis]
MLQNLYAENDLRLSRPRAILSAAHPILGGSEVCTFDNYLFQVYCLLSALKELHIGW